MQRLRRFKPTLALLFISSELDIEEVAGGAAEVLGDCPIIGTSSAGEIADGYFSHSAVVSVIASPRLRVHVGLGNAVSSDFKKAVNQALESAGVSHYFSPEHALHQMLHISSSPRGFSPVFLTLFSPGATKLRPSLSHDIHTELRKRSGNRIPILGGSSSDYFRFEANHQIFNGSVYSDSIVLAFIEADILFGLGMAHGFSPTTKRALVTRACGHVIKELDGRPAVEVCAELLEMPIDHLGDGVVWFSQFPFGATDVYGNSILHVPEYILPDGSIQFGPVMQNDQVLTLMRADGSDIALAGVTAYENAVRSGGLKKPCLAVMLSCALRKRLMGAGEQREMELIRTRTNIPVSGFYTFGEQGMSSDGLPVYSNQSVSMLVFSDELNPIANLMRKRKRIYREVTAKLDKKETQIKIMGEISQLVQEERDKGRLAARLSELMNKLFHNTDWKLYLPSGAPDTFSMTTMEDNRAFPPQARIGETARGLITIPVGSHDRRSGLLVAKPRRMNIPFNDEDWSLAKIISELTARGLERIEIERKLANKLSHLEIFNRLSHEVSKSITTNTKLLNIIRHIRGILNLTYVSLWLVDPAYQLLVKEVFDEDKESGLLQTCIENDEKLARWQIENCRPLSMADCNERGFPLEMSSPLSAGFVSLPTAYNGQIRGILNSFWSVGQEPFSDTVQTEESIAFLSGIVNQFAIFIENKFLQKNTTFLKEIHHRVKNNLQNVASILRLQIRRLEGISAEQALSDSISRIMSIAVVHETLYQEETGMVDLRKLIGSVSALSMASQVHPAMRTEISGPCLMLPSREATSMAMIVNELLQNAVRHAHWNKEEGKLSIIIEQLGKKVSVTIQDEGPGLPPGFDPDKDGNLGLMIVRTLVKEDLHGELTLDGDGKTTARVLFPLPKDYCEL